MNKLRTATAIGALIIVGNSFALETVTADSYLSQRASVQRIISHAHYSAYNSGTATLLSDMADRAHNSGMISHANNLIALAQEAAKHDLRKKLTEGQIVID